MAGTNGFGMNGAGHNGYNGSGNGLHAMREQAVAATTDWNLKPIGNGSMITSSAKRLDGLFGADVFSERAMRSRLPKDVFKRLMETIKKGVRLDPELADVVAAAMKDWAIENGGLVGSHAV